MVILYNDSFHSLNLVFSIVFTILSYPLSNPEPLDCRGADHEVRNIRLFIKLVNKVMKKVSYLLTTV